MSTKEMQKRRKQEREKLRKTPSAESPRKKTSGKVRDGQTWVPLPSDQKFMVPVGKSEKYPTEIGDILRLWSEGAVSGGLIAENTLYAIVTSVESVVLGERDDLTCNDKKVVEMFCFLIVRRACSAAC